MDKKDLDYVPKNLDEAILQLDNEFDDSTKQAILNMDESDFIYDIHFSTGMWIRNNWGLWGNNELTQYFINLGIGHADDMSSIILTCYYRHLKSQEYGLENLLKHYQDYWKRNNRSKS